MKRLLNAGQVVKRVLEAGDLYSGAGGSAEGLKAAAREFGIRYRLTAVNHNPRAIESHTRNHPDAKHLQMDVDRLKNRALSSSGSLDILSASPGCPEHSYAKGGASLDYRDRASAWAIVREAERYRPKIIIVENVPPFRNWGPIEPVFNADGTPKMGKDGHQVVRPIRSRRGATFDAWFAAMESIGGGYTGQCKILNSARFGAAQSRERLFMVFTAPGITFTYPDETHGPVDNPAVIAGDLLPYNAARSIIQRGLPGRSIFLPHFGPHGNEYLSANTLMRVLAGVQKFCSPDYTEAFLVVLRRNADARSLDLPIPSVLAQGNHLALVEPVLRPFIGANRMHNVPVCDDSPTPCVTTAHGGGIYRALPVLRAFVLGQHGGSVPRAIDVDPVPTVTTDGFIRLAEPFMEQTDAPTSLEDPRIVEIDGKFYFVDLLFRMFDTVEIARAQSFADDYVFIGNRGERTMQIGNAVEVLVATALYRQAFLALGYHRLKDEAAA